MIKRNLFILVTGLFLFLFSLSVEARTNVNLDLSLTATPPPAPAAMVVMPPQGYSNCYMVPGTWMGQVWVPPHQECSYPGPSGPSVWVAGYWGCYAVGPGGHCRHWRWYGNRWSRGGPHDGRGHYGHRHHRNW